ncbi:hypothetical protein [Photobacterium lutimaris]|uniref:Core-binding (CB) domain-containing protein n=1 Tax=Photobacterium lutimaris TaxID=388278 RepID=A0A2T3IIA8_9GAMM|nr:hypothetical protein [Photobacterium lutimaris]PSU28074.1 hypothetical protein C9I99_26415 [Photobacterium lutimaris]TDR70180.1 hypothetical protein DFP78_12422 [Photobacterium lutimaris]
MIKDKDVQIERVINDFEKYNRFRGVSQKTQKSYSSELKNIFKLSKKNPLNFNSKDANFIYYALYDMPANMIKKKN